MVDNSRMVGGGEIITWGWSCKGDLFEQKDGSQSKEQKSMKDSGWTGSRLRDSESRWSFLPWAVKCLSREVK